MTSLRLRALAAATKPIMRWRMGRIEDPVQMRRMFERASKYLFRAAPYAHYARTTYQAEQEQRALWVSSGACRASKVILYLHGGGYVAGSPWGYRKLVSHLCRASGLRAFVPGYRLAPEHPLPAALDDVMAAHHHLLEMGYAPKDIVIGGDSAGGGLTFALLAHLCERNLQPAAAFAWSPCLDLTYSGASVQENAQRDHVFPGHRVHELAHLILGDSAADDPKVSPLFAAFPGCPPVLLQVGDTELLRDDSVRMEAKLRAAGTETRLETWNSAPHVWQFLAGYVPDADQAIENTARFMLSHLPDES